MRKIFLSLFCLIAFGASAQTITEARFVKGDNPEWKSPKFDDSQWKTVSLLKSWDDQGIDINAGYGWYRLHFTLDKKVLETSDLKEEIVLNLGCIDDCDVTYLNGEEVGRTGQIPEEGKDYRSRWNTPRQYRLSVKDKRLKWGKENVLAVRVYSGNAPGGWFRDGFKITVPNRVDNVRFTQSQTQEGNTTTVTINVENLAGKTIKGELKVNGFLPETMKNGYMHEQTVTVKGKQTFKHTFINDVHQQMIVTASFTPEGTTESRTIEFSPKYILTPSAPKSPRWNGAVVYGIRPGSPMHWRLPVSGERPMKFSAKGMPAGLKVDAQTGALSGAIKERGDYKFTFVAENSHGKIEQEFTVKVGNNIALTPPMGWNSWNCWGLSVSEEKVMSSANAIIEKGLADYGYNYINVDDAWEAPERNADGTIAVNEKFPDMKRLGDRLHEQGMKFGIYSSPGDYTCGQYLGSLYHEKQDAESYNSWGVDYLKYDWCGYGKEFAKLGDPSVAGYVRPYLHMEEYLRQQPRDIFYSLCQYGMAEVWKWGHAVDANSWRTTGDITDTWESLYHIGFQLQAELYPYAAPGHWNDPDMLIVGKVGWSNNLRDSRLTPDEQYTHITLWSLLASNLLIGCDVSQIDDFTINVLCNHEVNQVNQDPLGKQARRVLQIDNGIEIWARPLADGTQAVGIFNLSDKAQTFDLQEYMPMLKKTRNTTVIRDLWRQKNIDPNNLKFFYPKHGCYMLKIE